MTLLYSTAVQFQTRPAGQETLASARIQSKITFVKCFLLNGLEAKNVTVGLDQFEQVRIGIVWLQDNLQTTYRHFHRGCEIRCQQEQHQWYATNLCASEP